MSKDRKTETEQGTNGSMLRTLSLPDNLSTLPNIPTPIKPPTPTTYFTPKNTPPSNESTPMHSARTSPETSPSTSDEEKDRNRRPLERTASSENLEDELRAARTSTWFETFLNYSDEKDRMGRFFRSFFDKLADKEVSFVSKDGRIHVLDEGSGEGKLLRKFVKAIGYHYEYERDDHGTALTDPNNPKKFIVASKAQREEQPRVTVHGVELDPKFAKRNQDKLSEITGKDAFKDFELQGNIVQGDCFNEEVVWNALKNTTGTNGANLILASNIGYYTPDKNQQNFIDLLKTKLNNKQNAIIIAMHEAKDAQTGSFCRKYGSVVDIDVVKNIHNAAYGAGLDAIEIPLEAALRFPNMTSQIWLAIESAAAGLDVSGKDINPKDLQDARNLIEFVIQRPLESLHREGRVREYLDDLRTHLNAQNNQLIIKSTFQIIPSENMQQNKQVGELRKIAVELEKEFSPSVSTSPRSVSPVRTPSPKEQQYSLSH
jgi:hypothetical protein